MLFIIKKGSDIQRHIPLDQLYLYLCILKYKHTKSLMLSLTSGYFVFALSLRCTRFI